MEIKADVHINEEIKIEPKFEDDDMGFGANLMVPEAT